MNETEARELLRAAAGTIDVPPRREILVEQPRRPRWVVPVAAAVAVVVAIGGAVLLTDRGGGRVPTPTPSPPTPTPSLENGVPSVFAYDAGAAEKMLEDLGLLVTRENQQVPCGETPGRALRTAPRHGWPANPGDRVTLFVSHYEGLCPFAGIDQSDAWRFLDFANRRGPAPAFADRVTVIVNGSVHSLSHDDAELPESWPRGTLDLLAGITRTVEPRINIGKLATANIPYRARLVASHGVDTRECGPFEMPRDLVSRPSSAFEMWFPTDGFGMFQQCTRTNLFKTDGAIETVVVRTMHFDLIPPDMRPTPKADPQPSERARELARAFERFAHGDGFDLDVADTVDLYLNDDAVKSLGADQAHDRSAYALCMSSAPAGCDQSATIRIGAFTHQAAITGFVPKGCTEPGLGALDPDDVGAEGFVVLSVPEPETCADDWAVQLFRDDDYRLVAVNLLLGSEL